MRGPGPLARPRTRRNRPRPPMSPSIAVTGTILAHGLPCMSTNMAKRNSTPSAGDDELSSV